MQFTAADLAYIHASYVTLDELCAGREETAAGVRRLIEQGVLPRPSYVLDDGAEMYPADYFRLVDDAGGPAKLRAHFAERLRAAGGDDVEPDWRAYLAGIYGVCLREVTPEAIARKARLVSSLCELLVLARPADPEWRERLRTEVDELQRTVYELRRDLRSLQRALRVTDAAVPSNAPAPTKRPRKQPSRRPAEKLSSASRLIRIEILLDNSNAGS